MFFDPRAPCGARVYDYFLGGKDNYAVDREAGEEILAVAPDTLRLAREQRKFLVRTVRFIAQSGVRQFIDVGSGIPTSPNVHEVARSVHRSARVAYVDFDRVVLTHCQTMLETDPEVVTFEGDVRDPDSILEHPQLEALIDWREPVAVLLLAVLHNVSDDDDPSGIIARFRARMAPGSHIAISQFDSGSDPTAIAQAQASAGAPWPKIFRSREQIQRLFGGFELLAPGVVSMQEWRPDMSAPTTTLRVSGGVGRKN